MEHLIIFLYKILLYFTATLPILFIVLLISNLVQSGPFGLVLLILLGLLSIILSLKLIQAVNQGFRNSI